MQPLRFSVNVYYWVTFSSRLIMLKINAAESRQHTIKISHNCERSSLPQKKLPTTSNLLPTAVASSQPPCIRPWKRGGATFETNDRPIGLRKSSAIVRIRYELISQYGITRDESGTGLNLVTPLASTNFKSCGDTRLSDAIRIIPKPTAAMIIPIPIFLGVDGSSPRLFSQANKAITKNVSETMNNGLNDWKISGEIAFSAPAWV